MAVSGDYATKINKLFRHAEVWSKYNGDSGQSSLHLDSCHHACQFSNWMSSSQFQCHRDVINDTKVRIGANTSRTAWRRGAGASAWVPSTQSRNRRVARVSKVSRDWPVDMGIL